MPIHNYGGVAGGEGGIGSSQSRTDVTTADGNIMCFPFRDDLLDDTTNHTIDTGSPAITTTRSYDSDNYLNCTATSVGIVADTQAFQVADSSPLTFGFFCQMTTQTSTAFFMSAGLTPNNSTYGLYLQTAVGWRWQGNNGDVTNLNDHRQETPVGRWFHIAMRVAANRDSGANGEFFINGTRVFNGGLIAAKAVASGDNFYFNSQIDGGGSGWTGLMSNVFIADSLLSNDDIQRLSDESFGHASPYVPGAV